MNDIFPWSLFLRFRQICKIAWEREESLFVPFCEVTLTAVPYEIYSIRSLLLAIFVSLRPTIFTLFLESSLSYNYNTLQREYFFNWVDRKVCRNRFSKKKSTHRCRCESCKLWICPQTQVSTGHEQLNRCPTLYASCHCQFVHKRSMLLLLHQKHSQLADELLYHISKCLAAYILVSS